MKAHTSDYFMYPLQLLAGSERYIYCVTGAQTVNMSFTLLLLLLGRFEHKHITYNICTTALRKPWLFQGRFSEPVPAAAHWLCQQSERRWRDEHRLRYEHINTSCIHGDLVGWGTALHTCRSRVRFAIWSWDFSMIQSFLPSFRTMALGSNQFITEIGTSGI
jgi:hypothetical protein